MKNKVVVRLAAKYVAIGAGVCHVCVDALLPLSHFTEHIDWRTLHVPVIIQFHIDGMAKEHTAECQTVSCVVRTNYIQAMNNSFSVFYADPPLGKYR